MKAVRIHEFGGIENLRFEDAPEPEPSAGEALVKVRACALNHLDLFVRSGIPAYGTSLPHILGSDIAGEVAQNCGEWKAGDAVIVHPGLSCGRCEYCLDGRDNICTSFGMPGAHRPGGYAEYVAVDSRNLLPKPEHLSWVEAASIPLVFVTAYHMLLTRARLQAGEKVVVLAAGSGVGTAATQLAKMSGATVVAVASTQEKLDRALELGADHAVNYTEQDWTKRVRALTGDRGPDLVVEHVGQATFPHSVRLLAPGGRIVVCGSTTGPDSGFDLRYLWGREITILGSMLGRRAEMTRVVELFNARKLRPVVDSVFPLAEAAQAQRKLADRNIFGKVVLEI
jgi:NADPH:quinone reductase-like Zn-dependent oxidoreductase